MTSTINIGRKISFFLGIKSCIFFFSNLVLDEMNSILSSFIGAKKAYHLWTTISDRVHYFFIRTIFKIPASEKNGEILEHRASLYSPYNVNWEQFENKIKKMKAQIGEKNTKPQPRVTGSYKKECMYRENIHLYRTI